MKFDLERDKLLVLLLITDLVFVILHIVYINTDQLLSSLYSLSRDQGFAEFFQYTKELWVAILLLILAVRQRRPLYLVFSLLFLYFLIDDAFQFHEEFGKFLADFLHLPAVLGLRPMDFGELLVSGVFGLLFLIALALFYSLTDALTRRVGAALGGLVIVLAIFGVGMDMVEVTVTQVGAARALVTLEEAGEMVVMSLITWFVFRLGLSREPLQLEDLPFFARFINGR